MIQVPMGQRTIYLNIVTIYTLLHADKGRNKSHLLPAQFTGRNLNLNQPFDVA